MSVLSRTALASAAAVLGVALVGGAGGASVRQTKAVHPHGFVTALALDGSRAAFGTATSIVVWDIRAGKTTKVSLGTDAHLGELAIAGSRLAWHMNATSNLESDDYLYSASLSSPKAREVAGVVRSGAQCGAGRGGPTPACAGTWLGGVVGAGNRILVNRWTTDTSGAITHGGLYALQGKRLKPVATGGGTIEAAAADPTHIAILQWHWFHPGSTVHIYSAAGRQLSTMRPSWQLALAVSGRNLAVLERSGKLALYDTRTGALRRTFDLHAKELSKDKRPQANPHWLQALAVQAHVAVYSKPVRFTSRGDPRVSAIHALNLLSGKDRVIGRSAGQIPLARMDSLGLVYYANGEGYGPSNIVFLPLAQVNAAVS